MPLMKNEPGAASGPVGRAVDGAGNSKARISVCSFHAIERPMIDSVV